MICGICAIIGMGLPEGVMEAALFPDYFGGLDSGPPKTKGLVAVCRCCSDDVLGRGKQPVWCRSSCFPGHHCSSHMLAALRGCWCSLLGAREGLPLWPGKAACRPPRRVRQLWWVAVMSLSPLDLTNNKHLCQYPAYRCLFQQPLLELGRSERVIMKVRPQHR